MPKIVATNPKNDSPEIFRICTAQLASLAPYSQSLAHETPFLNKSETHDDFERRTWREKAHVNGDGIVCIPGQALHFALQSAAAGIKMKIKGKGQSTYTKCFVGGIILPDLVPLGVEKTELEGIRIYCHATGERGSGKRVWRWFPIIRNWTATVSFQILDAQISPEIFEEHLRKAGLFIGIGRWSPRVGGHNGRFKLVKTEWSEQELSVLMAA